MIQSYQGMEQENKQPIVEARQLTKQYRVGKNMITALDSVDIQIAQGEFVAITGESGSGKSTLLQLIGCLDKPTSGNITVDGNDINRLGDTRLSILRSSTIGFIFQSFYLQPFLRLEENIAVPAMFMGTKRKDIRSKTLSLLEEVGLTERSKHYPRELSGGQMQRAAIARALINEPKILLADEPTGNLDSKNSDLIINLLLSIRTHLGMTIVIVTHNQEIARKADRIITLNDGRVV
jgi:putative ABC transport system ATP-binding protein